MRSIEEFAAGIAAVVERDAQKLMRKVGRPPIGDRPMTPAERKARSRANALGDVHGHLEVAAVECEQWAVRMRAGRHGVTGAEIGAAFEEIGLAIARAQRAMPRS